jgi:hypothetical protein
MKYSNIFIKSILVTITILLFPTAITETVQCKGDYFYEAGYEVEPLEAKVKTQETFYLELLTFNSLSSRQPPIFTITVHGHVYKHDGTPVPKGTSVKITTPHDTYTVETVDDTGLYYNTDVVAGDGDKVTVSSSYKGAHIEESFIVLENQATYTIDLNLPKQPPETGANNINILSNFLPLIITGILISAAIIILIIIIRKHKYKKELELARARAQKHRKRQRKKK